MILIFLFLLFIFPFPINASGTGYWHTEGNKILDSENRQVRITGVNWFGLETESFAPHGLWTRGYKEMMDQIKSLGYNTIRLPYSNDIFNESNKPSGIDFGKNPDLQGLSGIGIMDKIVMYADQIGMKIILDRHRPTKSGQSSLWYTDSVSEQKWIDDWKFLTRRYKGNTSVIGADLHNEPNGAACWGCNDNSLDWKRAAERAGNAILSENSSLLIIVEGIQRYGSHWYWWGGNLEGVANAPVNLNVPNRIIYSLHDYPQSVWNQSWFNEGNYPQNLPALWDTIWGYIHKRNIAPVLVGEFGSKLETQNDRQWFEALTAYIKANNLSWIYWSWNPNSGDTGGILTDDWRSVHMNKQNMLTSIQYPLAAPSVTQAVLSPTVVQIAPSPSIQPSPTATPAPSPILTTIQVQCAVEYTITQSWNNNGFVAGVTVKNTGKEPIQSWKLAFEFPGNQQIQNLWNGTGTQNGRIISVSNADWNKAIVPGGSATFGFVGAYSGANDKPTAFTLNGGVCSR